MPDVDIVKDKLAKVISKADRLRTALAEADEQVNALRLTIRLFEPPPIKPRRKQRADPKVNPDELRNLDIEDALVLIAERDGGFVYSSSARPLLVEAGLLRGKQISNQ